MSEYAQSNGISITNQCYDCMQLDYKCYNCEQEQEARDAQIAHEIVDEGNLIYKRQWSRTDDQPSASEWVSSVTVSREILDINGKEIDYIMRLEFNEPTVQLVDGGVLNNLLELEDYAQTKRERLCQWCNILTPKMFNDCQVCDKPLENNLVSDSLRKEISRFLK
jgi:hypothetical protein